jgi:hypothetical protein
MGVGSATHLSFVDRLTERSVPGLACSGLKVWALWHDRFDDLALDAQMIGQRSDSKPKGVGAFKGVIHEHASDTVPSQSLNGCRKQDR